MEHSLIRVCHCHHLPLPLNPPWQLRKGNTWTPSFSHQHSGIVPHRHPCIHACTHLPLAIFSPTGLECHPQASHNPACVLPSSPVFCVSLSPVTLNWNWASNVLRPVVNSDQLCLDVAPPPSLVLISYAMQPADSSQPSVFTPLSFSAYSHCASCTLGSIFFFSPDQGELVYPVHHMVLETTSQNQGSELSGATMIPEMTVVGDPTRSKG